VKILVDTSVWVGHFKQRNEHLVALLESGLVVCHSYVVIEVACGSPPDRHAIVSALSELETVPLATQQELLGLIARQSLHGCSCGFVDVSLLAAALLANATMLWTLDKRLDALATTLNVSYRTK
jgi:predicted nucleic acid-binding protein